ncbi:MAG TPA: class I SAM-dependent methyltransferase [Opitutaceae bacterium]|nr:class I SAM-dependent methyltransferase [Opitutaceae bacterium]
MLRTDYVATYRKSLQDLIRRHGEARAMDLIVGGEFETIGIIEGSVLKTLGLDPSHSVVDVGCGSGRLAARLAPWLRGPYQGCDILPELADHAARICRRPDWSFASSDGITIPAADGSADFVCFFSVFTHLEHDDIFRYLAEAGRVAKPGGRIVFSYLDFTVPSHWTVFETTLANRDPGRVLNQFISKGAIETWCRHLGLEVERLYDGPEKWIRMDEKITYADGRIAEGMADFGQSIGVVRRRP